MLPKKIKSVAEFLTSTLTIAILLENWILTTIDMIYFRAVKRSEFSRCPRERWYIY